MESFLCGTVAPAVVLFAFGIFAAWLGEAHDEMCATVKCPCGRREMRDVVCGPQDRAALARELNKACFHCSPPLPAGEGRGEGRPSAPRVYLGDHDGE